MEGPHFLGYCARNPNRISSWVRAEKSHVAWKNENECNLLWISFPQYSSLQRLTFLGEGLHYKANLEPYPTHLSLLSLLVSSKEKIKIKAIVHRGLDFEEIDMENQNHSEEWTGAGNEGEEFTWQKSTIFLKNIILRYRLSKILRFN